MNELIKIQNQNGKETVNARDLHIFLESLQDFSDWIKNRIEKFEFIENQDFTIILGKSTGGRPTKEYYISLEMAKELSMVENNEKGKHARKYFIECEKIVKSKHLPQTFAEALRLAADQAEQIENQKKEIVFLEKTKAFISDKKTATAMNTASQFSKQNSKLVNENNELKIKLDESTSYASITLVAKQLRRTEKDFNWRKLKTASQELNLEIKKCPHPIYGYINTYNYVAWLVAYNVDIANWNLKSDDWIEENIFIDDVDTIESLF